MDIFKFSIKAISKQMESFTERTMVEDNILVFNSVENDVTLNGVFLNKITKP